MEFLQKKSSLYHHCIVKMNVVTRNLREKYPDFSDYLFVFSTLIQEENSLHGKVDIELVPESDLRLFHENVKTADTHEFNGDKILPIGSFVELRKNESDYDTKYIAVLKDQPDCQHLEKNILLFTRNRGKLSKLDNIPHYYYAPEFEDIVIKHKADQRSRDYSTSIKVISQVKEQHSNEVQNFDSVLKYLKKEIEKEGYL